MLVSSCNVELGPSLHGKILGHVWSRAPELLSVLCSYVLPAADRTAPYLLAAIFSFHREQLRHLETTNSLGDHQYAACVLQRDALVSR